MTTATQNKSVLITGNTYPVKDALRALGGRWDAAAKGWRVPVAQLAAARALVPAPPPRAGSVGPPVTVGVRSARAARRAGQLCPECGDDCGGGFECGYA